MKDQERDSAANAPPRPLNNLVQIAYVTNDIDRAREIFQSVYGVEKWLSLEAMHGAKAISVYPRHGGATEIRVAVAYVGVVQFELIQPLVDPGRLYSELLPADGTFAIRFHHIGLNKETHEAVRALEPVLADTHPIPMAMSSELISVFYADARDQLGHYLEFFNLPAEFDAQIPRN